MYIKRLELRDFRNYEYLDIDPCEKVNLILGKNAQGKTNLLEALYMSAIGRSFRTSKESELIKFGSQSGKIKVYAVKNYLDVSVEIILNRKGISSSEKFVKKDGKSLNRASQLIDNILIVIFSPEDLKIVKDEPEKRRRFINRELVQISHSYYEKFTGYCRILAQRNAFLKGECQDKDMLDLWDTQLAEYGSYVIKMRADFIRKISGYSAKIHSGITAGAESLEIKYEPDLNEESDREKQKKEFYDALKKAHPSDMRNRTTSVGPHRDDIGFFVNGLDMRSFGSQGQQRTCALSLKLAEIDLIKEEMEEDAVLLLDDVMSELDADRQEYLISTMKGRQMFITTTDIDESLKEKFSEASVFYINNGSIDG